MSSPRKDNIPNQDKSISGIQKYQFLPSHVPPFSSGFKSFRNETNDDNLETIDSSRSDKDYKSCTNQYDYIYNVKATKKEYDDKYKEENPQYQYGNENVI